MFYETLKDGTNVVLREPTPKDQPGSLEFFLKLTPEDRKYLRVDVTNPEIVERRIHQSESGDVYRLWAFAGDEIVGDGALEFSRDRWRSHLGEMRVILATKYQRRGLGGLLIRKLFDVAKTRDLEKIVMNMLSPQASMRAVCEELGFRVDAVIPDYAKDAEGMSQSLVVMTCTLDEWFREMSGFYEEDNWDG